MISHRLAHPCQAYLLWKIQNPLPPLRTVHDMRNLTAAQLDDYLDTYGIPYGRRTTREAKISSLRTYIGCTAEV